MGSDLYCYLFSRLASRVLRRHGASAAALCSWTALPRHRPRQSSATDVSVRCRLSGIPRAAGEVSETLRRETLRVLSDAESRASASRDVRVTAVEVHAGPPTIVYAAIQPRVRQGGSPVPGTLQGDRVRARRIL